jgi:predicted RecB family nuclease
MPGYITKDIFLKTFTCPTLGWETIHSNLNSPENLSLFDKFKMQEGIEVQDRARKLYPQGFLVGGDNPTAAKLTQKLLDNKNIKEIFEATFISDNFITKVDILKRENKEWKLIEIKSGTDDNNTEYLDDLAYTTMVVKMAGFDVVGSFLLLVSKDYRLGMSDDKFFKEYDCSEKIIERVKEFREASEDIAKYFKIDKKSEPDLKFECKNCSIFEECCGKGIKNHIFELPRISSTKFCQLKDLGVISIRDIPAGFELTNTQIPVYQAVKNGEPFIDNKGLKNELNKVKFPVYYLDFETVTTAIPLYENIAPYEQIPTQYSIHRCSSIGEITEHLEYLADPSRDCRRELAESLIRDCGSEGSIFSYSSFEKTVINGLKKTFPDLDKDLEALTGRIIDLCAIFQKHYYHLDFHGSYSIKGVLPVLVPKMSYEHLDINDGGMAMTVFAYMVKGRYNREEMMKIRENLLEYCKQDTLAMVRLHERLWELVN